MIGINSQILSPSGTSAGVGFAVPVSIAKRVVPQLLQTGQVTRPKLGISTRNVSAFRNQVDLPVSDGVLFVQVQRGGGARGPGAWRYHFRDQKRKNREFRRSLPRA